MSDPKTEEDDRACYYAQSEMWSNETFGAMRNSRSVAWVLAVAAVLVMLLNTLSLMSLLPFRRIVIYPITVEGEQGASLAVQSLKPGTIEQNPIYTQSMIATYVRAKEEFAASRIARDYNLVELFSDPAIRKAYSASLQKTSGVGPLTAYPSSAIANVAITSISLLDEGHALVEYTTTRDDLVGAQPEQAQARLAFTYVHGPMRKLDRYIDPLGFQVTDYSKTPL